MCWELWLTVRFLSQEGLGWYCVVHFVPGQLCIQCCEGACAMLTRFPCCDCYMQCYHPGHTRIEEDMCLWVSGRILTLLQQGYLSSEIRQTILINKSQLGINSQLWNLKTLLFPVSLFYQFSYIYIFFLKPKYRDILTDWIGPFSVF